MARTVNQQQVQQKRRHLADIAARLFALNGYENTSVTSIAREAGTSPASVFYYFGDKAALFRAAFEQDLQVAEGIAARADQAVDVFAAILDIVTDLGADATEPGADGMVVELARRAGQDPELVALVAQTSDVLRQALAGLIARGISEGTVDASLEPQDAAAWLQSVIDGAYLNAVPGRNPGADLRRTARGYLLPHTATNITPEGHEN